MQEVQKTQVSPSDDLLTRRDAWPIGDADSFIHYQPIVRPMAIGACTGALQTRRSRRDAQAFVSLLEQKSDPARSLIKRGFDIATAMLSLFAFLPALVAIALAIKLTSRGPIMFRQLRYGLNNKKFLVYKFRTLYFDKTDATGVKQTRENDERITPIGKVLRRYSLDEIPQLINVVKGEMSLVGPRPHVPGMLAAGVPYETLVPEYFERHRVRPGLTGLAQARGYRGSTVNADFARFRIDSDLEYIRDWSFALDIRIMIETVWREFLTGGNGI